MYRDSAPGSIARGLQRVSRHRGWRLEKQIILILTHGHLKVAVLLLCWLVLPQEILNAVCRTVFRFLTTNIIVPIGH